MERKELEVLQARLQKLERQLRFTPIVCMLCFVVLGMLGMRAEEATSQPTIIRARGLQIVDLQGRARMVLDTTQAGSPAIALKSANGSSGILLGLSDDGGIIMILGGRNGQAGADIVSLGERASVELGDSAGRTRVRLEVDTDGPRLQFFGANKQLTWSAP